MKLFKAIASLSLALLVLASSSSFTVNMHICGDHIQSISLIERADACPMEVQLPPCHKQVIKKTAGCCQDSQLAFEGKDFSAHVFDFTKLIHHTESMQTYLPYIMDIVQVKESITASQYPPYKPPVATRDIPVLIQSFLI
jgi:hypothetical protein